MILYLMQSFTGVKIRPIGTQVFSDSRYETRESLPSLFRLVQTIPGESNFKLSKTAIQ